MNSNELGVVVLAVVLGVIVVDMIWSHATGRGVYNVKETLANLAILVGAQLGKPLSLAWQILVLSAVSAFTPLSMEQTPLTFILALLATDFAYYWAHRIQHEVKALWTLHVVHHSSPWMNLTTAFRINWLSPFVGIAFYLPVALLGVPPTFIGLALTLNLTYQFFTHTEAIGTLGPLEGILNTPSAHRVHHGSNSQYIDKNYGGVLIIWDRLFGTYEPEVEKVRYGITTGFVGHNPLKVMFHGFIDYATGKL
jgi:sterol desaturase/sphingolipid hydroxylase (fatty acid hydroxylase superfamily)